MYLAATTVNNSATTSSQSVSEHVRKYWGLVHYPVTTIMLRIIYCISLLTALLLLAHEHKPAEIAKTWTCTKSVNIFCAADADGMKNFYPLNHWCSGIYAHNHSSLNRWRTRSSCTGNYEYSNHCFDVSAFNTLLLLSKFTSLDDDGRFGHFFGDFFAGFCSQFCMKLEAADFFCFSLLKVFLYTCGMH